MEKDPSELESQVVKKAENAMSEVAGVKKITSQIYENMSSTHIAMLWSSMRGSMTNMIYTA